MSAGQLTLSITRGLPLRQPVVIRNRDTLEAVDLTGISFAAALDTADRAGPVIPMDVEKSTDDPGVVFFSLDAAITALMTKTAHVWDAIITDSGGQPEPFLTGLVEVNDNTNASHS